MRYRCQRRLSRKNRPYSPDLSRQLPQTRPTTPLRTDVDTAHYVWAQGLDWLPPPLRVGLFLFLALALLVKGGPVLLRLAGGAIVACATPAAGLLTYPEYLTTSLC